MSRRSVLRLAGVGVLLAGTGTLASCMSSGSSSSTSSAGSAGGSPGDAFAGPAVLTSSGGRLDLTLTAGALSLPWGSGSRYAFGYNGSVPGPTLRVRPGDIVTVRLVNQLE